MIVTLDYLYTSVNVVLHCCAVVCPQTLDVDDVDGESVELDHDFRFLPDVEDTSSKSLLAACTFLQQHFHLCMFGCVGLCVSLCARGIG